MVIASIDLMDGKAVQLRQGKEKVLEREDVLELAREFDRYGEIAVIDLDAALGKGNNSSLIKEILKIGECRVGGGIRSIEQAREWNSLGARKVIIGSRAFKGDRVDIAFLQDLQSAIGKQQIIIAIDAVDGEIVTHGWKHRTGLQVLDTIPLLEPFASEFLFTSVEREGLMQGTDWERIKEIRKMTQCHLTVAGGIHTIEEIKRLARLGVDVQLGMALYTKKISLTDAFIESLNWKEDYLPTVVQDLSGQVLMLAYSTPESLRKTFQTGKMHYFSRSRQKLWMKGETSGNIQKMVRLRADCDRDTILARVVQHNVACHTGSYSCFGSRKFSLQELYEVIRERLSHPQPGSYTATLTPEKVREKLLEEAQEVVEAQERDHIIWEAADVLYFLTVLLAREGISLDDVLHELNRRRKK